MSAQPGGCQAAQSSNSTCDYAGSLTASHLSGGGSVGAALGARDQEGQNSVACSMDVGEGANGLPMSNLTWNIQRCLNVLSDRDVSH